MNEILQITKELEGVIGAVLGTVSTLIVTELLKNKGKLNCYINDWEAKFDTYGDVGCSMMGKTDDDLYGYGFSFELQIYNSCDVKRILRNITITFHKNGKEKLSIIPYDESTRRRTQISSKADKIKIVNIIPKEIIEIKLSGWIIEEDLYKLDNIDSIYIGFYNEKNKKVKKLISKNLVS